VEIVNHNKLIISIWKPTSFSLYIYTFICIVSNEQSAFKHGKQSLMTQKQWQHWGMIISVWECIFLGMQNIFAQIWSCISQITCQNVPL